MVDILTLCQEEQDGAQKDLAHSLRQRRWQRSVILESMFIGLFLFLCPWSGFLKASSSRKEDSLVTQGTWG